MITFITSLTFLIVGYTLYGKLTERIFVPSDRVTPAFSHADGVDYVNMPTWKVFLIQLLNIAGTGPIFGALMGAVFGPVVFLWIVFGSILGGAVHDYLTGMISVRMNGVSMSEIIGKYLGGPMKQVMRFFSIILLVLVGAVFVESPAMLLAMLTPQALDARFWTVVILLYYLLATLFPIDTVIGRIYPIFGIILILMVVCITGGIIGGGYAIPELTLSNLHPEGIPIWPYMFVTVACGAISGFHATQSPMMARCIRSEYDGRRVFYGAMIAESVIALCWAAAGIAFYGDTSALQGALTDLGQSGVVYDISTGLLGRLGGVLAIVGVVICPISSGDTAFRSARLTFADWFHLKQDNLLKRTMLTVPLLLAGGILTLVDFDVVWRYFAWSNQTLAMIMLWAGAVRYVRQKRNFWLTAIPATFMSAVSATYILIADEGPGKLIAKLVNPAVDISVDSEVISAAGVIAYPFGIAFAVGCFLLFWFKAVRPCRDKPAQSDL